MTCAACRIRDERLAIAEERILQLEAELGAQAASLLLARLLELPAFVQASGRPQVCKLVAALYGARGRVVSLQRLFAVIPSQAGPGDDERHSNFMSVLVHRARKALGADAIQNVHGVGYRLTDRGLDRVAAILGEGPVTAAPPKHDGLAA